MVELNTKSDPRKLYGNGLSVLLSSLQKNIHGNGNTKTWTGRDPDRKIYRIGPCKLPRARNRQKQTHNTLTYISYTQHTHTHTHTHTDKAINRPGGRQIQTNRITPHNLTSTRTRTCKNKDTNPYPHIHMNIHIQISTDTNTYTLANLH